MARREHLMDSSLMSSFDDLYNQYKQTRQAPAQAGGATADDLFQQYYEQRMRPRIAANRTPMETPSTMDNLRDMAASPIETAGRFLSNAVDAYTPDSQTTQAQPLPSRQPAIERARQMNADFDIVHPLDRQRLIDISARVIGGPTEQDLAEQVNRQTASSVADDMSWASRRATGMAHGVTQSAEALAKLTGLVDDTGQPAPYEYLRDEVAAREPLQNMASQFAGGMISPESIAAYGLTQAVIGPLVQRFGAGASAQIAQMLVSRGVSPAVAQRVGYEAVRQTGNVAGSLPVSVPVGAAIGAAEAPEGERLSGAARGAAIGAATDVAANIGLDTAARGLGRVLGQQRPILGGQQMEPPREAPNWVPGDRSVIDEPSPQQAAARQVMPEPEQPVVSPVEPEPASPRVEPVQTEQPVVNQQPDPVVTPAPEPAPEAPAAPRNLIPEARVQGAMGNNLEQGGNTFLFINERDAKSEVARVNRIRGSRGDHVTLEKHPDGFWMVHDPMSAHYGETPVVNQTPAPETEAPTPAPEPARPTQPEVQETPAPASPVEPEGQAGVSAGEPASSPALNAIDESAKLPVEVSRASPRYGYINKNFTLKFDNDIDKAAYILQNKNIKSKSEQVFRDFLRKAGMTDAEISLHGRKVKDYIKSIARRAEQSGEIAVPKQRIGREGMPAQPKAAETKPAPESTPKPKTPRPSAPEPQRSESGTPHISDQPYVDANKADNNARRLKLGLDQIPPAQRVRWRKSLKEAIDDGTVDRAMEIAASVNHKPHPLSDTEIAGIMQRQLEINSDMKILHRRIAEETSDALILDMTASMQRLREDLDVLTSAMVLSGTQGGRAHSIRGMRLAEAYDYSTIVSRAKSRAKRTLSSSERKKLEDVSSKIEKHAAELKKLEESLPKFHAKAVVEGQTIRVKESLDAIKQEINRLLGSGCRIG